MARIGLAEQYVQATILFCCGVGWGWGKVKGLLMFNQGLDRQT
jgi:hypothetical protein